MVGRYPLTRLAVGAGAGVVFRAFFVAVEGAFAQTQPARAPQDRLQGVEAGLGPVFEQRVAGRGQVFDPLGLLGRVCLLPGRNQCPAPFPPRRRGVGFQHLAGLAHGLPQPDARGIRTLLGADYFS